MPLSVPIFLPHLPGQVQASSTFFQLFHYPDALLIMGKSGAAQIIQYTLPGMSEWRMPQIVPQGDSLRQILVETQRLGHGSGYLGNLQGMGQPGTVMIPPGRQKYLGFVLQTSKGLTVQNPIPISLIIRPDIAHLLLPIAAPGSHTQSRIRT